MSDATQPGTGWLKRMALGGALACTGWAVAALLLTTEALAHAEDSVRFPILGGLSALALLLGWIGAGRLTPATFTRAGARLWFPTLLMLSALVVFATPLSLPTSPMQRGMQLRVVATGEKNPASKSIEVWLFRVTPTEGRHQDPGLWVPVNGDDWERRKHLWISFRKQPAEIAWSGFLPSGELQLLANPWSGIAEVHWRGQVQRVDCYAPEKSVTKIQLDPATGWEAALEQAHAWICRVGQIGALLVLFHFVAVWLVRRKGGEAVTHTWAGWYAGAICLCGWSVALYTYWPALFTSPDALYLYSQGVSGNYREDHPHWATFTVWLLTRLWESPGVIAHVQVLVLAVAVGWVAAQARRVGAPLWLILLTALLLAALPSVQLLVITVWIDVPYAISMVLLTGALLRVVTTQGAALKHPLLLVGLVLSAAAVVSYRHNGLPVGIGAVLLLWLGYRRYWRQLLVATVLLGACVWGVRVPLRAALDVQSAGLGGYWAILPAHVIAAHHVHGTKFESAELALMEEIRPLPWKYNAYYVNSLFIDGKMDRPGLVERGKRVVDLFWKLTWRDPWCTLKAFVDRGALTWAIVRPPGSGYYVTAIGEREDPRITRRAPQLGLSLDVNWPAQHERYLHYQRTSTSGYASILWRSPGWMYLMVAGCFVAMVRRQDWRWALVLGPALLNSAFLAVFTPGQDYRYQFGVFVISILLGPLLFTVARPAEDGSGAEPDAAVADAARADNDGDSVTVVR